MSSPGSRRGLELLIRKRRPDGTDGGFEIKVFRADRAFLKLRPVRREDVAMEVNRLDHDSGVIYLVHLPEVGRHVHLTRTEMDLWGRMDGRHTIQDLAAQLVFEHGCFDFDEIRRTLGKLRGAGLVEVRRPETLRSRRVPLGSRVQSLATAIATYDRRWEDVDPGFARLYRVLRPVASPRAWPLLLVVGLAGLGLYLAERWTGRLAAQPLPLWAWAGMFVALTPAMTTAHELAHGLAVKGFGRTVRAVGLTVLDNLVPSLYVDVTDMYLGSRRARILVSMAGPLANLVLAALATAAALLLSGSGAAATLVVVADLNLVLALYTAWPFTGLSEDGYDALSEAWRVTLLRQRAWAWLRARLRGQRPELPIATHHAVGWLVGMALTWSALLALVVGLAWRSAG